MGKLSDGGKIIPRRRKNYPAAEYISRAGAGAQKFEKKPKIVAECRKYHIPNLYTLNRTIPYLYTLNRLMPYLNTLNRLIPYLNTLNRTIPYLNTLSRTVPYLNTLSRTIPYLNTLSRTIHYHKTLSRTIPYLNTLRENRNLAQSQILVGSQSESSTKKTLKPRQPIRIEYHSAETYPILIHCRNIPILIHGWGTLLDSGHESAAIAYLNTWRVSHPPPTTSAHTLTTPRRFFKKECTDHYHHFVV